MTGPRPLSEGKRLARMASLIALGALGVANFWLRLPREIVFLLALVVPFVWLLTGFDAIRGDDNEMRRRQRKRNIAIGLSLFAMVALFYAATMVRMNPALETSATPPAK